jgi:hypothetical protein
MKLLRWHTFVVSLLLAPCQASAVRPFITDDARVVGDRAAQVETWVRIDEKGFQHWVIPAVGVVAPLEVSFGAVHGTQKGGYTLSYPIVQTKLLVLETEIAKVVPGVAFISGVIGPGGVGTLRMNQWDAFTYLAFSESILNGDRLLVHQNLGVFVTTIDGVRHGTFTWGLGTQVNVRGGFHFVGELFSGDPYASNPSVAVHVGIRHFVSRAVQFDATIGKGISNDGLPPWCSAGIRIASTPYSF